MGGSYNGGRRDCRSRSMPSEETAPEKTGPLRSEGPGGTLSLPSGEPLGSARTVPTGEVDGRHPLIPPVLPRVPGYDVLAEVGRGGMGVVYKARQDGLERIVALKMILTGELASPLERRRFRTEAEAISRLQHTNIVAIYETGEHEGRLFLSLEFCPGGSLAERLAGTPLEARQAAELVEQLARGVACAHAAG